MTTSERIVISPQDIIARFKMCDPPSDFEAIFGPVASKDQRPPLKYETNKHQHSIKLNGTKQRNQQLPQNATVFNPQKQEDVSKQEEQPMVSSFENVIPQANPIEQNQQIPQQPMFNPQNFYGQQMGAPFPFMQPTMQMMPQMPMMPMSQQTMQMMQMQMMQMNQQPMQMNQQPMPMEQQPMQMPFQSFTFGAQNATFAPQQASGFEKIIDTEEKKEVQQPEEHNEEFKEEESKEEPEKVVYEAITPLPVQNFDEIVKEEEKAKKEAEKKKAEFRPVFEPVRINTPTQDFDELERIERNSIEQQKKKIEEEKKLEEEKMAEKISYEAAKETPVQKFDEIEKEEKSNKKQEQKKPVEKKEEPQIKFNPVKNVAVQNFDEIEKEEKLNKKQQQQAIKKQQEKQKQEEKKFETPNFNYTAPKPTKNDDFVSLEEQEQIKKAIEASLRETKKKPETVITYGAAPTPKSIPKFDSIINAEINKTSNKQTKEKSKKISGGKFTPYVPPKKEPLPKPVQPNIPSFEEIMNEQEGKGKKQKPAEQQTKKGKAKFVPFEAPKAQPFYKQQTSSANTDFSALLNEAEKHEQPAKSAPKAETKKGKKKFVPFQEPPKTNPYAQVAKAAPAAPKGPSFDDLFNQESKASNKQEKPKSGKRGKRIVISQNVPTTSNRAYDPHALEDEMARRRAAANRKPGNMFEKLMEEEERKAAKSKSRNPTLASYGRNQSKPVTTNFEDLLREEAEKEDAFEKAAIPVNEEVYAEPQFPSRKNKKKKAVAVDEGLFWGTGDLAPQDFGEPVLQENDFPSLARNAPGQQKTRLHNRAMQRLEQQRKDAPVEWLAAQLTKAGLDDDEAREIAPVICGQGRQQMIDSIRSLVTNQSEATSIINTFFRKFPKPLR